MSGYCLNDQRNYTQFLTNLSKLFPRVGIFIRVLSYSSFKSKISLGYHNVMTIWSLFKFYYLLKKY